MNVAPTKTHGLNSAFTSVQGFEEKESAWKKTLQRRMDIALMGFQDGDVSERRPKLVSETPGEIQCLVYTRKASGVWGRRRRSSCTRQRQTKCKTFMSQLQEHVAHVDLITAESTSHDSQRSVSLVLEKFPSETEQKFIHNTTALPSAALGVMR